MGKFIIGLVLGVAIAAGLAFYLNNMPNQFVKRMSGSTPDTSNASSPIILAPGTKLQEVKDASSPANTENNNQNASNANASSPSYDFYNVLQGKNASDVQKKAADAQKVDNTKGNKSSLYVEAGAFANADAASNMAAQLTLLGYTPKIRTEQTGDKTVNQILIGPFDNQNKANDVIKDLNKEKITAVIYKEQTGE